VVDKEKECFLLLSLLEKGRRVESEREEKRTLHYNLSSQAEEREVKWGP
jgi:hypothetical protein